MRETEAKSAQANAEGRPRDVPLPFTTFGEIADKHSATSLFRKPFRADFFSG